MLHHYEDVVLRLEAHEEMEIPLYHGEHLIAQDYYRSTGSLKGQIEDYRRRLSDDRGIHIRHYGDRMTMHWDHVDPSANLVGHLVRDAPLSLLAAVAIGVAILGGSS